MFMLNTQLELYALGVRIYIIIILNTTCKKKI